MNGWNHLNPPLKRRFSWPSVCCASMGFRSACPLLAIFAKGFGSCAFGIRLGSIESYTFTGRDELSASFTPSPRRLEQHRPPTSSWRSDANGNGCSARGSERRITMDDWDRLEARLLSDPA